MFGVMWFHIWFMLGVFSVRVLVCCCFMFGLCWVYFGLDWIGFNSWFTALAYFRFALSLLSVYGWCMCCVCLVCVWCTFGLCLICAWFKFGSCLVYF